MKSETASSKPQPLERSLRLWNSSTSWNSIIFSPSARAFEQDKLIYYILNEIGANKARLCHKVHFANYFFTFVVWNPLHKFASAHQSTNHRVDICYLLTALWHHVLTRCQGDKAITALYTTRWDQSRIVDKKERVFAGRKFIYWKKPAGTRIL